MPSMMIHLLTAYKLKPDTNSMNADSNADWWVGNVSPDAKPMTREEKDISHLRNYSNADREIKLRKMADALQSDDLYNEGKLLHLYCDYYWDIEAITSYYKYDTSANNFRNYRNEIAVASAWLFHTKKWTEKVWQMMLAKPDKTIDETAFITRNYDWHSKTDLGVPVFYTPDYIETFTDTICQRYTNWFNK